MDHPYGFWSLVPPVAAIGLAIVTRRAVLSLLAGIFVGALITTEGDPFAAVAQTLEMHLWKTITEEARLRVFAFTLLMGAMVGVMHRAGGMQGLIAVLSRLARRRRGGQVVAWLLGLCIFFDDYANTVLLGHTLRPLADRLKISREKLAYIVDSTAAPVAGLALVSTWVAGEISFIADGLANLPGPLAASPLKLFIASIPYRFYVLLALVFVLLVGLMQRDFGPMLLAERACRDGQEPDRVPTTHVHAAEREGADSRITAGAASPWYNAVIPIAVCVGTILTLLYHFGITATAEEQPSLITIFGNADPNAALLWGSLAGLATAALLARLQGLLSTEAISQAALQGASLMLPALAILWAASALSAMTGNDPYPGAPAADAQAQEIPKGDYAATGNNDPDRAESPRSYLSYRLYTGEYLRSLVGTRLPVWLLPTVVFLLSAATAFATGTSWGTMGIVMPMVVPLAYAALAARQEAVLAEDPILLATVGSVLAGAIFGDHCSPISDTTVLSSQASGCNHVAHVWTQLPYAVLVGGMSILLGTLPVAFGVPPWPLVVLGSLCLALLLRLVGQKLEER